MVKLLRTFALAGVALIACATTARAQQEQQAATEFPSWQLPGWTLTPGVIVGELYDSNVALATPASGTNETASDRLFEIEPYGQAEYIDPRTTFSSGYRGVINRYSNLSALDNVDHTAFASVRRMMTRRLTLSANDYFMRSATTDQLELNGVPFVRAGSSYNAFNGAVDAQLSRTTQLTSRYDFTWANFERKDVTLLSGGTVNGVSTDVLHTVTARTSIGGEYTLRWADLNVNRRLLAFQEFGAVVQYRFAPAITFEVSAGVGHLSDFVQQLSRTGPYVSADFTDRLRRATAALHYERRYTPTLAFGASNQSQAVSGNIQMPITRRGLYVESAVLWRATNPILVGTLPLNSAWIRATAGYALQRWIRIEVYDSFAREEERTALQPIHRTIAGVQIVLAQPMRIR